jgi:flavin-dependent thymidylate synthase
MKIYLAGYNLDADLISKLKDLNKDLNDKFTPETISAAYARISRDSRPVNELRAIASSEVDKARKSNNTIIFEMGHSSVAEHSVFNFDIVGLSRLAIEELEHFRLCSYTEKSQRYITLTDDFVVPAEITDEKDIQKFKNIIAVQNNFYHELFEELKKYVFAINKDLAEDVKNHRTLEGWAKEDARYICALATEGQLGMTVNARTLELMLRRLNASALEEVKQLGLELYNQVKDIAPSVVRYTKATDYDKNKYQNIKKFVDDLNLQNQDQDEAEVKLLNHTKDGDDFVVATILHTASQYSFEQILAKVKSMDFETKKNIVKESLKDIKLYDTVLREFEYLDFEFEINISSACFGQMKRHRMATITTQNYDVNLGVNIPQSIVNIGYDEKFLEVISKTNEVFEYFKQKYGQNIAEYVLTNSHRRKMIMKINARELYHLSRLREDKHAQWDIRIISSKMVALAKKVAPITTFLICGKDKFVEIYDKEYI